MVVGIFKEILIIKMVDSIINCKDLKKAEYVILSVGYDATTSFRKGANKGPKEIINCLNTKVELFERFTKTEPAYLIKIGHKELKNLNKLSLDGLIEKIAKEYKLIHNQNNFVLMLGGDHSVSIGVFKCLSQIMLVNDVTIVQIDAHMDLRDDDSEYNDKNPSKYAHSCVMRRAIDFGFKTVQIGIRDYSREEYEFSQEKNLKIFEWGVKENNFSIDEIVKSIKTDRIYLTIDMDGLDPACAPAVGTPVPGGLDWNYASALIRELAREKYIVGADIVEVAPRKDDVLTEYVAAQMCYNTICYVQYKKVKKYF